MNAKTYPPCLLRDADQPEPDLSNGPTLEEVAAAVPQLEILRLIGHGGMGYVYRARQTELDRMSESTMSVACGGVCWP